MQIHNFHVIKIGNKGTLGQRFLGHFVHFLRPVFSYKKIYQHFIKTIFFVQFCLLRIIDLEAIFLENLLCL